MGEGEGGEADSQGLAVVSQCPLTSTEKWAAGVGIEEPEQEEQHPESESTQMDDQQGPLDDRGDNSFPRCFLGHRLAFLGRVLVGRCDWDWRHPRQRDLWGREVHWASPPKTY